MEETEKQSKRENMKEKPTSLEDYLRSLSKRLKSAQGNFWKDTKLAEETFHKEIAAAMHEYEKVEYTDKRVPGSLAEAGKEFNERYEAAYKTFGKTTKEALARFQMEIEELIGG
jgi:hypothetical protein